MSELWPWLTLGLLGAFHGINPGMGWLFAVALGLQEQRRKAVLQAFAPIALGHALSIAGVVALVVLGRELVSPTVAAIAGGSVLLGFGLYKLLASGSHPRWLAMRVDFRHLAIWSFLMATAHGAGLMLVPALLSLHGGSGLEAAGSLPTESIGHAGHTHASIGVGPMALATDLGAVVLHTASMFLVMALIAVVVYEKVGLAILRQAWFNLDRVWAAALIVAGGLTLALSL
jgi:hypothetical protein